MGDINPATQRQVLEFYQEEAEQAATVGDYVRVHDNTGSKKACFGPLPDGPGHDWRVVEIDWENGHFILAPIKRHSLDE